MAMHFEINNIQPPRRNGSGGFSLIEGGIVLATTLIVTILAIPSVLGLERTFHSIGDGQNLYGETSLARMRASADFTHSRVYADLSANSTHIEVWNTTSSACSPLTAPCWVTEGGTQKLASADSFGYGSFTSAPPNTQGTFGQAAACLDNTSTAIANTACIVFNSRGIPIDNTGGPTGQDALYISNGQVVYGITVSATGLMRMWRGDITSGAWTQH